MPDPTAIYLDCDTGIDDALALAYLLAETAADVVGIGTVSGNVGAATAARNTLHLLRLAGADSIPVAVGAEHPLDDVFDGGAPHVHGVEGLGDVRFDGETRSPASVSAGDLLLELSRAHPGTLTVLAVGPLTNLALALERDPTLPSRIARVVVMGGAVHVPGTSPSMPKRTSGTIRRPLPPSSRRRGP